MTGFRMLEHTADTGLVASGATIAEAFAGAAEGLFAIIAEVASVKETELRRLEISEENTEDLLFTWLNNLIYLLDTEMLIFRRFDVSLCDGKTLKAVCYGEKYDASRHHLKTGIKAATYHMLRVDTEKNQVQVIFDI
ncbi:MAG: archease [Chloroflexota bacterium]